MLSCRWSPLPVRPPRPRPTHRVPSYPRLPVPGPRPQHAGPPGGGADGGRGELGGVRGAVPGPGRLQILDLAPRGRWPVRLQVRHHGGRDQQSARPECCLRNKKVCGLNLQGILILYNKNMTTFSKLVNLGLQVGMNAHAHIVQMLSPHSHSHCCEAQARVRQGRARDGP